MTSLRVAGARFAARAAVGLFAAFLVTVKAGAFYLPVAVGLVWLFDIVAVAFWGSSETSSRSSSDRRNPG